MTDFEREDLELKSLMGGKFLDMTEPLTEAKPTKVEVKQKTSKCKEANVAQKPSKAADAEWHPTKERTWVDSLKECVKWAVTFGGLNSLIFYWQIAGLMDESIAVPCMWVCCALAGYGVGLNIWRGAK